MIHAPIYGSQFNPRAKLYKCFTVSENVSLDDAAIIVNGNEIAVTMGVESNVYHNYFAFAWTEADDIQSGEEQPIRGLVARTERMTIKFHGRWKPKLKAVDEPEAGDLLLIGGELYVIEDGIQRVKKKSLVDFATVFLSIRKLL